MEEAEMVATFQFAILFCYKLLHQPLFQLIGEVCWYNFPLSYNDQYELTITQADDQMV